MDDGNYNWSKVQEYRSEVRHICSVLGWSLVALVLLTQLAGILFGLIGYLLSYYKVMGVGAELYKVLNSGWFSIAGSHLLAYALVLPVTFAVMEHVPEVKPEKKRMRPSKFFMFFVMTMGAGYILNIAGSVLNLIVAVLTGRNTYNMNPVNNLFDSLNIVVILYVSVLGPIIEEYIFRWKLINRLRPLGEKAAILFSALMFGLMHGNLSQILYATAIGVVLGYIAVKTGRMKYNCILHIMVNSYSTLLVLLMSKEQFSIAYLFIALAVPVITLGAIVASIVIFCVNVKRTRLLPGKWPEGIEYRDFSSAMYLNSGTVVFIVLNLLLAAFYLFLA